jgi:hypothetical protein
MRNAAFRKVVRLMVCPRGGAAEGDDEATGREEVDTAETR